MLFTKGQLVAILGCSQAIENKYIDQINAACTKYSINTMLRLAAFIAQVGHESGRLSTVVENLNYSAEGLLKTWPSRFTAATAAAVSRQPEKIANIVYASRLGNTASGDGWKYRGRGLIQITGKSNYDAYSQSAGFNAVSNPDALLEPTHASLSAGWFWDSKSLNSYADRSDFLTITKRINGGTNGQADRELLYKKAIIVLSGGVPPKDEDVDKVPMPASASGSPTSSVSTQKTPGAQNSSIVEPRAIQGESKSKYPWNFVNVSRSGHITEVDDTPGYERLNMTHRTGSYWEIDNTGTYTIKSILDSYKITKYDSYDYVGGNYTQQVKGQSYRQSDGDMIFKSNGTVFVNSSKVQMNTGMLSVSGEVNSPSINSQVFGGMSGLAFGDLLAKQALVAYDLVKGSAPMLGSSLGFKSAPGATDKGSADGQMSNNLSNYAPNGTPWITNGVRTAANVVAAVAMAKGVADLLKSGKSDEYVENSVNSAATDLDNDATKKASETPVFLKHVTFDKPTLISQSTSIDKPDPALYVNNIHTIVNSNGRGRLHMSNGVDWVPIGDGAVADHDYTDEQVAIIIDKINQNEVSTTNKILAEAQERANAILNEANARQEALEEEARARQQAIVNGVLAEAVARGAAIQAESTIRQNAEESLANRILELTASTDENIAAAIFEERQARTTAIEAEAFLRETLATKFDENVASITESLTTLSNETSASTEKLNMYISSNDESIASFKTQINTKVDDQGNALSSRIDSQQAANEHNAAMIESESTARVTADGALATRIDTLFTNTDGNSVAIQNEVTARTTADTALGSRIDTMVARVSGIAQGANLFVNAGFKVTEVAEGKTRPQGWTYEYYVPDDSLISFYNAEVLPNGPDGYNFARLTAIATRANNTFRFGLRTLDNSKFTTENIRPNVNYIIAARFRTIVDADVGKTISLSDTNYPFNLTIIGGDGKLTKEWKWFVLSINYNNTNYPARNFYLTYNYSNTTEAGTHSFDVATPMLAEGTTFLGFNLGEDQRILVNTAAITNEETVRADADSALSQRITTLSSTTTIVSGVANAAKEAADAAKVQADKANAELANIASDNILSKGEKSRVLMEWNTIDAEKVGIYTQADALGVDRRAYADAIQSLSDYLVSLSPGWSDSRYDTPIDGATFRNKFTAVYTQRQIVLNAIANSNNNKAVAANQAATAAANQAAAANAELANIASDNILSKGEKSQVRLEWDKISLEQTGIVNQADALGVPRSEYAYAVSALADYLSNSIGPYPGAWADNTVDSPINGTLFRQRFADVYVKRQEVLNAIAAKNNSTAVGAKSAADAARAQADAANAELANIASDNILSKGEKSRVVLEWNVIDAEKDAIWAQADAFGVNKVAYVNAVSDLSAYLVALSPNWADSRYDTPIDGPTFRFRFKLVYAERQAVLNAIAARNNAAAVEAKGAADQAAIQAAAANAELANIASDNVLSKGEKSDLVLQWQKVSDERPDIEAKANLLGVDHSAYTQEVQNLSDYLVSMTPNWGDSRYDTPIDGPTFRYRWSMYFASRQALLNAIAAKAATMANWDSVDNRPLDNGNLVRTPSFELQRLGTWNGSGGVLASNPMQVNDLPNLFVLRCSGRDTIEQAPFPVSPGEKIYGSALINTQYTNYTCLLGLVYYNEHGQIVGFGGATNAVGPGTAAWVKVSGSAIVPAGAVRAATWVQINGFSNLGYSLICNMSLTRAQNGATVGATWGVDVNGADQVDRNVQAARDAATNAQNSADAANNQIANISSDNILSRGEKATVLLNWNSVDAEVNTIRGQADAFGVSRVEYDTAYQDLSSYLSYSIGPYNGAWADTNIDSAIDGATFRLKWSTYYGARQRVLTAITNQAKALADQSASTNAASITRVETTLTNATNANASSIQSVSSTVNGHTATINQNTSSIQGVQANYGVKVNNNGYISGFGLLSEPVNGNIVSTFDIMADRFKIQAAGVNGGAPITPFSIDSTTNPPTISLNGNIQIGGSTDGTGGKNVMYNSGPSRRTIDGYSTGYNTTGYNPTAFGQSFDPWSPAGYGGVQLHFGGSGVANGAVCDINNDNKGTGYPVEAGGRYEASVYLSNHRCATAIGIIWLDYQGNYISEVRGNTVSGAVDSSYTLSGWPRSFIVADAPGNAVKCYINIRTYYYGQNDPYTFASMMYFGRAGNKQTSPSPWSPAGVTSISGGMIVTDSLSTLSATIGTLQTRDSGARVQIRDDIIKVFNDSNVAKIKIGNLTL